MFQYLSATDPVEEITDALQRDGAVVVEGLLGTDVLDRLGEVAERVGPTVEEISTPLPIEERPRFPDDTRCPIFGMNLA